MEIRTELDIAASADSVWNVLVNYAAYPAWNPVVPKISGEPRVGGRVRFSVRARHMTLAVNGEYTAVQPGQQLRWIGPAAKFLRGPLNGTHYFLIEPLDAGGVRFVHGERFEGFLEPVVKVLLARELTDPYNDMNQALKRHVEYRALL